MVVPGCELAEARLALPDGGKAGCGVAPMVVDVVGPKPAAPFGKDVESPAVAAGWGVLANEPPNGLLLMGGGGSCGAGETAPPC